MASRSQNRERDVGVRPVSRGPPRSYLPLLETALASGEARIARVAGGTGPARLIGSAGIACFPGRTRIAQELNVVVRVAPPMAEMS